MVFLRIEVLVAELFLVKGREEQLALQQRAMLEASGLRPVGRANALNPFSAASNAPAASTSISTTQHRPTQHQHQHQTQRAHQYDAPSGSRVVPIVNRRRPAPATANADAWNNRAPPLAQQQHVHAVPIEESSTMMPVAMETREDEEGDLGREWDAPGSLQNRIQAMDVRDQMGFRPVEERSNDGEDDDMVIG